MESGAGANQIGLPGLDRPVLSARVAVSGTRQETRPVSRNVILVFAAICWTGAAADAALHLLSGDLLVPAAMGLAFVGWVVVRRRHYSRVPQTQVGQAPVAAEA
jgi:hypothetical protein